MQKSKQLFILVLVAASAIAADRVIRTKPLVPATPVRINTIQYELDVGSEANPVVSVQITTAPADGSPGDLEFYKFTPAQISSWADSTVVNGVTITNKIKPVLQRRIQQAENAADEFAAVLQRVFMVDGNGVQTNIWMIQPPPAPPSE